MSVRSLQQFSHYLSRESHLEAIHLVGILGGKSAFSEVFCFSLGILNFLREKWRFFTFSKGKCKIPRNFDFSLRIFTFSSKILSVFPPKYRGKSEKPEGKLKIPRYFAFSLGKSKKPPLFPQKSQNTEEKVKNWREKSKFRGILHFPPEKVKNLHFSPRKVKILGEKSKYRGKSKIPRKKHFFLLKFRPDELPLIQIVKTLILISKS